jgi:phosphate transport system substrate-binding protein
VYRSDGSGTTYVFTDYLSKISPEFASKIGRNTSVRWPVGIGQKGNEGVSGMIRNSPFSFGYVELVYAVQNKMLYGQVRNAAGKWMKASTETVTAAAAGASKNMPADYRVSITNAAGADSYPISSFTWMLIPVPFDSADKGKVMHDFLEWMLDHGEAEAAATGNRALAADDQADSLNHGRGVCAFMQTPLSSPYVCFGRSTAAGKFTVCSHSFNKVVWGATRTGQ